MNNVGTIKQSSRLLAWATVGLLTLIAAISPWFAVVANACQNHGGGC